MKNFPVRLPDDSFYECEVECRSGCPVKTDARGYLLATAKGNIQEAYAISRATNPFASICGKVCGAPCEAACRRGDVDHTLVIRNMKGYLTEKLGPETGDLTTPLTLSKAPGVANPEANGKSVGIIGAGCAGLTCAHDLARLGYRCTVYEKHRESGGMLIQGVPINRLSRHVIQSEIDSILKLGLIEIKHNTEVGKDISLDEIRNQHDAVFVGVGLSVGKIIPMPGSDNENVASGLQFLLDFNFGREWDLTGRRSIVIGGGDVAFDVARSALRCNSPKVNLCCLEREALGEMPGSADERSGGLREGVIVNDGWGPDEILIEDGKVRGLKIKKVKAVFDNSEKFSPSFEEETRIIDGDIIFMAVGQTSDLSFMKDSGIDVERDIITIDPVTGETTLPGVYAGGDIASGAKLFIDAVESGSKASLAIHSRLSTSDLMRKKRRISWRLIDEYSRDSTYLDTVAVDRTELDFDVTREPARIATQEYSDSVAVKQSQRCLECHIHPTFAGDICILCGGCVDVCPSYCLRMVHINRVQGDATVNRLLAGEFGKTIDSHTNGSAMLFDPLKCVRCGMCATKCPTGACKMAENSFEDIYCSTKG